MTSVHDGEGLHDMISLMCNEYAVQWFFFGRIPTEYYQARVGNDLHFIGKRSEGHLEDWFFMDPVVSLCFCVLLIEIVFEEHMFV